MHNPGEMNSERHYFALIGDIIDSRHEQDRYDVQKSCNRYFLPSMPNMRRILRQIFDNTR